MATALSIPVSDPLLSREEAAAYLGVSPSTLAAWVCLGRYNLPMVKVGRLCKYRKSDLDRWLASRSITHSGQIQE